MLYTVPTHEWVEQSECCWDSAWQVQYEFNLNTTVQILRVGWSIASALPRMSDAAAVVVQANQ